MLERTALPGVAGQRAILVGILAIYLALSTLYSVVNPLFEAPDELWHYGFVHVLRTGQGLPLLPPGQDPAIRPAGPEALQPPLYYALAAALTFWVPGEPMTEVVESNPAGNRGYPGAHADPHVWTLLRPDRPPYSGEVLAAHLARLVSVVLGALTVLATWLVARELAPQRPMVWALAAGLNALIPQFLFISSAVNNDVLATCVAAWGLLVAIRAADRAPTAGDAIRLGALAGLGALAKLSDFALLPLGLAALLLGAWRNRGKQGAGHSRSESPPQLAAAGAGPCGRRACSVGRFGPPPAAGAARQGAIQTALPLAGLYLGLALAIPSWWLARNVVLYGDPLAFLAFVRASGGSGAPNLYLDDLAARLRALDQSFWALFGWFSILADPAVYLGYDALALVGAFGLAYWATRARRGEPLAAVGLASLWLGLVGGALANYELYLNAWQGRLLFPALAAICGLLALGLASLLALLPGRWPAVGAGALLGLLMVPAALAPFRYIAPAYAAPALLTESDLAGIPHRLYARFGGKLELLGYDLPSAESHPGGEIALSLYWRAIGQMDQNYAVSVQLLDQASNRLAQSDGYPGRGNFPTRAWRPGDALRDTYRLPVPIHVPGPTIGRLAVSVYRPGQPPLPARDERGEPVGEVIVARVKLAGSGVEAPPDVAVARFGDEIRLVGYSLDTPSARRGDSVRGELRWSALSPPRADYTVFVHLVGPGGLLAQHDFQPARGTYPTSFWSPGELIADEFVVPIGPAVPIGDYALIAGLYDSASGRRLTTAGGDFAVLGTVRVTE